MLIRFCSGIGIGCIGSLTGTLIPYLLPAGAIGRGISYFSLSSVLALALGPFLGIFLMGHISYNALFLFCLVLALISFVFALLLRLPDQAAGKTGKRAARYRFRLTEYIDYAVFPIASVSLLAAVCYGNMQAFLAQHAGEAGLKAAASTFFLVYAVITFASRPLSGRLFDFRGANIVVYPALLIAACGFILLSKASTAASLLTAGALLGIGMGNFQTTAQSIAMKLVPKERLGQATSTYFIFFDLGIAVGPYFLGMIVPGHGYQGVYGTAAALALLCIPLYYFMHGRRRAIQ
jgi:MFS family permease